MKKNSIVILIAAGIWDRLRTFIIHTIISVVVYVTGSLIALLCGSEEYMDFAFKIYKREKDREQ